ncbi:HAMP domain-containing methyl-accepting chemotaxis protein [Thalassotalea sediminis]|uniref:HAMP domain-containing methyl-accepting chemotaxis protein n=1 Tax=Thalassotalea sediminis TaxID=1759089 RepID=UPI0025746465|nr:methyl-accepting chemotaxis protein [Thalassotalea sediminis]
MNLTVKVKIIGGFSIIAVLLIITSVISLSNLNNIHHATLKQSTLAIPTLSSSTALANQLSQIGGLTLRGYYQTELVGLADNLERFNAINQEFISEHKKLKSIVSKEQVLLNNLAKIEDIHNNVQANINAVFSNRKAAIEQYNIALDTVDVLEEKADDAATLMLDLADHDLADTKLQRAVSLGEQLESQLNGMVASSFEYRDLKDIQATELVESQITNGYENAKRVIREINNELALNNADDIADELTSIENNLDDLLLSSASIFTIKNAQLSAIAQATAQLEEADTNIALAKKVLATQVELANETTSEASTLVEKSVNTGTTVTWIIMLVSIGLAAGIAFFVLISITRPLTRVNDILNVVASGDLSRKLDDSGKDEFAQLSRNCNTVIDSLRDLINGIVSRSTQLATAAEQTSAVTAQSTTAIEEQRTQVEQAASATTEMSSTSQSVLSSANDALGEIKQADDEAERIKGISNRNRMTIEQLANEVEDASQVINKLQQDSASIGGILDVIRGIAEQTNLLALNAAIEAARAGEQGRGFAVVADEVRTLASRTQESTQEIQNMIEVLQTGAEKAVAVMETGKKQASECVVQSGEAEKALEVITHAVHEAFDRSSQIASAAEEQSTVAHEISENLESIVAIAEQTTSGSQQTAQSSSEVAQLAEELQQSVREFKL